MRSRSAGRALRSVFPEAQALRILFYPAWLRGGFLLSWLVTSLLFYSLMTFRSLRPLSGLDSVVIVAFGGLMPLTLLLGFRANRAAKECHLTGATRTAAGPAMALSVFASVASCMCCLPLLPMALGAVLAGTAFASGAGAWVAAISAAAPWLYLGSAILLLFSLHRNAQSLVDSVEGRPT